MNTESLSALGNKINAIELNSIEYPPPFFVSAVVIFAIQTIFSRVNFTEHAENLRYL